MRIIAGEKRGIKLFSPTDESVRPTYDRVKEAVFGRLQFSLHNKKILDLFCGSGALGLETLSRGAEKCCFCDVSSQSCGITKKNIQLLGYENRCEVFTKDYISAINFFKNRYKFDIVFIDPPYSSGYYEKSVLLLAESKILSKKAILVLESDGEIDIELSSFEKVKTKKYGKTYVTYLEYVNE